MKRLGHDVRILERNSTSVLEDQGAGLMVGPDIQAFLSDHDSTRRQLMVPIKSKHYLNRDGMSIDESDFAPAATSWDLLYYVLRANFDGLESAYCEAPTSSAKEGTGLYDYGHKVQDIRDLGEKVEVQYTDPNGLMKTTVADLVIVADGPSSTVRKLLLPDIERKYVGYIGWRGTFAEAEASPRALETFVEKVNYFHSAGVHILLYTIPGKNGSLQPGQRLLNYVWYFNLPEGSPELEALMQDTEGKSHRVTLPRGKMRPEILEQGRKTAKQTLPPQLAEAICATKQPFIQAITDVMTTQNTFFNGKVLLVGDAVSGFRPHAGLGTNQAAFDALKLEQLVTGEMSLTEWEQATMGYARDTQKLSQDMGELYQFGQHPMAQN